MSKTSNMVLFFAAATVFNLLLMGAFLVAFVALSGLAAAALPPGSIVSVIIVIIGFLASIVLTFLIYGWVMKKAVTRFNLEKHIPQLFKKKR
jgi:hypothetical protein